MVDAPNSPLVVLRPGLFKNEKKDPAIVIIPFTTADVIPQLLASFSAEARVGGAVGVAATFSDKGKFKTLAFAAADHVVKISLDTMAHNPKGKLRIKKKKAFAAIQKILTDPNLDKIGFDMEKVVAGLYRNHGMHISPAIDLQSMHSRTRPRYSNDVLLGVLGGETTLEKEKVLRVLRNDDDDELNVALRAWAASTVPTLPGYAERRPGMRTICSEKLSSEDLTMLSKCVHIFDCLHSLKPTIVKNDVNREFKVNDAGNVEIDLERYKTRLRRSDNQHILVETTNVSDVGPIIGRATRVTGKVATVELNGKQLRGSISSIHTVGREITNAELDRVGIILDAMHDTTTLLSQPLVRQIFFRDPPSAASEPIRSPCLHYRHRPLNTSQAIAVQRILSGDPKDHIVLIRGPPGTGKTTVIAASVASLMTNPSYTEERFIWLLAQSNVAVKNIAEKLADVGFLDFKLLVSNEFHFEWHEHLYEKIASNVIVSDTFIESSVAMDRRLKGSRVMLCTLSMFSHPLLMRAGITRLVPVETVLIDEASQIEVGDYLPLLSKFGASVRKLVFIGDEKQLAPYGADDVRGLRSVFEVDHLYEQAEFLGKQYRMPAPIGDFISRKVYEGRLKSERSISDRNCCRFVDVDKGREIFKGGSFQNTEEADAVVRVVRKFVKEGKSFRVITPYDAQRALLESELKRATLPWENMCFCIDSFQGNEDEHIIISIVRSDKIGFLNNLRRSNVMLSRCKKSMTICTSKKYIRGKAKNVPLPDSTVWTPSVLYHHLPPTMALPISGYAQQLLDVDSVITFNVHNEKELTAEILQEFKDSLSIPRAAGLGWANTSNGLLTVLVLASKDSAIAIQFSKKTVKATSPIRQVRKLLETHFLCDPDITLYSFDMGRLALSLYRDRDMRISHAVHIQDACVGVDKPYLIINAVEFAVRGTNIKAFNNNIKEAFRDYTWDSADAACTRTVVFRAWLAAYMPFIGDMGERLRDVKRIDTSRMNEAQLRTLAQLDRGDQRLDGRRPTATTNEFTANSIRVNVRFPHKIRVKSDRFQNRLRKGNDVQMLVQDQYGYVFTVHGRTSDVSGQHADIVASSSSFNFHAKTILDITTISLDDPTMAEVKRDAHILRMLQQQDTFTNNPFIHLIWQNHEDSPPDWPAAKYRTSDYVPPVRMDPNRPMNNSQQTAVLHMLKLDNNHRITIIQGPPGTGKTTVIATFVLSATAAGGTGIWLVAQSNVAVKNIAEKLDSSGFSEWRLLVSKDFHYDWHEHLYSGITKRIIRSDEFKSGAQDLAGVKVMLCTLSMLSHFKITIFTKQVPIQYLVVDEASQIKVSDYISPISSNPSLCKICFIGDDKQLPPFGQDEIEDIESIFERPHLRSTAVFLDRQYRMPPEIGNFISDAVYDGQLRSNPKHLHANKHTCFFVDVVDGVEKSDETSYKNLAEAATIVTMAGHLQVENTNFRIITPYDAQRSLIENMLKQANLVYANKCFNVDSFQGNEDDVIILSLVRSHALGFLEDLRRTNVMLTRCKEALFVCSSRAFLNGPGLDSLVGRMSAAFGEEAWIELADIAENNF
ncbi:hypothetical protein EUX98_g960 [Antrodiella citrinella]|uniref:Helicase ATP-binding domain-containing protein n=1 Tax=Antrodiella citrinella TaxID=2447956 RepID=A0A4S4N2K7_9APHY|nr:hypothetical protein EUX98_g960 [Antrodiella citrinella]